MVLLDEVEVFPEYAEILERLLLERAGVSLRDLSEEQKEAFLTALMVEMCNRAARERALGGTLEVQEGGN